MTKTLGVIFDFDGVLADSERLHLRAFQRTFATRGWALTDEAYYERYLGYADRKVVQTFLSDAGISISRAELDELLADKARVYGELAHAGPMLYAGGDIVVRRLAETFSLAIASGSLSHEIRTALSAWDLLPCFAAIVGADDVREGKPEPDAYLEAARRLGLPPASCVAIEDSPWGLEAARDAGAHAIGITHTYPAAQLTPAERVVTSLAEITPELVRDVAQRRKRL